MRTHLTLRIASGLELTFGANAHGHGHDHAHPHHPSELPVFRLHLGQLLRIFKFQRAIFSFQCG
jgi:hypothetical protein